MVIKNSHHEQNKRLMYFQIQLIKLSLNMNLTVIKKYSLSIKMLFLYSCLYGIVNIPSISVDAPTDVLSQYTFAPGNGICSFFSS